MPIEPTNFMSANNKRHDVGQLLVTLRNLDRRILPVTVIASMNMGFGMKSIQLSLTITLLFCTATLANEAKESDGEDVVRNAFTYFKQKFNKTYASAEEETQRLTYFRTVSDQISGWNKENPEARFEHNKFSDWSEEERTKLRTQVPTKVVSAEDGTPKFGYFKYFRAADYFKAEATEAPPTSVDWREKGHVTPVKNQAQCGSCYAFSATATIESLYSIQGFGQHSFSEQQIVDCDSESFKCEGGYLMEAFSYVYKSGLTFSTQYPYTAKNGTCQYDKAKKNMKSVPISGFVTFKTETEIAKFVGLTGPVAIGIKAPDSLLQFASGIWNPTFAECNKTNFYHAVTVVGYGSENNVDFWIAKNSWGPDWGEAGFFRIKKGVDACGLSSYAGIGQNSAPILLQRDRPVEVVEPKASLRLPLSHILIILMTCLLVNQL